MVCPMRVVLVAASLSIAAFVMLFCQETHTAPSVLDDEQQEELQQRSASLKGRMAHLGSRLTAMARFLFEAGSGAYLWRHLQQHRSGAGRTAGGRPQAMAVKTR